jgi:hypothetical protein
MPQHLTMGLHDELVPVASTYGLYSDHKSLVATLVVGEKIIAQKVSYVLAPAILSILTGYWGTPGCASAAQGPAASADDITQSGRKKSPSCCSMHNDTFEPVMAEPLEYLGTFQRLFNPLGSTVENCAEAGVELYGAILVGGDVDARALIHMALPPLMAHAVPLLVPRSSSFKEFMRGENPPTKESDPTFSDDAWLEKCCT